ncbi:MAG TPA: segregation/condensation protein A [Spirochaetota bacterium]|nr:segregation/condensation protein A [Spirochaetota bacterium]HOM87145.1 segregation/condensation protein A [Spirochaetota bacterium]HPD04902.1 segregation/condensation protein A [Spirochaetota bacterium]HRR60328.1 segregation/condensation protein A [Spirochaetota bacterium]HRV14824.1 segregation/condensation protein A [Spirochaetota bacterium]
MVSSQEIEAQCILHINNFEGPLDLLWELIKKSKIEITQVSIAEITDQYCNYLSLMEKINIPIAMDFIVMASELIYYKSKALLPGSDIGDEFFVPPLPPELIQKLLEFKKYQIASKNLISLHAMQSDVFARQPNPVNNDEVVYLEVNLFDLLNAFVDVLESEKEVESQSIVFDEILVSDRIILLISMLQDTEQIEFNELFPQKPARMEVVVTLLAVLEMIRIGAIAVLQNAQFGNMYIFKKSLEKAELIY